jgi:hypothetical protein
MDDFSIIFEDDAPASQIFGMPQEQEKPIVDLGVVNPVVPPATKEDEEAFFKPYDKNEAHSKSEDKIDNGFHQAATSNPEPDKDDSITKKYYEFMKESNLLMVPDDFEFDGTNEKLTEAHETTLANMQQLAYSAIMERLPEEVQSLVQYSLKGGKDYEAFLKQDNSFDISNEQGQISLIKHYYKNTVKWDDARIERYLSKTDEGELAAEAESIKEELEESQSEQRKLKIAEQERLEKLAMEQQKAVQVKITDTIGNAGFIEDKRKQPLKNFIFNAVRKDDGKATDFQRALNQIQTNPEHLIQLADLLMDYDKVKGLKYERFENKATTRVTKDLKAKLEQTVSKKLGSIGNSSKEIDWAKFIG